MSTRHGRPAAIPLCGALLLGLVAPLAACSDGSARATAGDASASTVINASSGPAASLSSASSAGSSAASTSPAAGSATAPATAGAGATSRTSPTTAGSHTATTPRPVTAGAANGRLVPSCKPTDFAQQAGLARGALQAYFFGPYAAGTLRRSGTAGALALLHGGQAVRFSTQQLVAARGLLATCPRPVGGVVQAVDEEVAALRAVWPAFAANRVPGPTSVARVRSAQTATTAAAAAAQMPLRALVPTAVQIQTG